MKIRIINSDAYSGIPSDIIVDAIRETETHYEVMAKELKPDAPDDEKWLFSKQNWEEVA